MRSARLALALFFVLASLGTADARAWWNDEWAFRKEISFDLSPAGGNISGSPSDVPILLRLSLGNFQFFGDVKPDASDFRFIAADDKTPLKFHIEKFDVPSQMALIWVRVPRLTGGAARTDKIFFYYGNPKAPAAADAAGSYDGSQALVYHFGPAAGSPQDSAGFKTEPAVFQAEIGTASLIGAGTKFNGTNSITVPANAVLQLVPEKGLTVSTWLRIEGDQSDAHVFELGQAGQRLVLGIAGRTVYAEINGAATPSRVSAKEPLAPAQWTHLAVVAAAGKLTLYVNGVDAGNLSLALPAIAGSLSIGASDGNRNGLVGELDEFQVANTGRPAEWLRAAAVSQGVSSSLVVYGGDTQKDSGGGEGYLAATLRNVTVDGWVVIGACMALLLMSIVIMIGKFLHLGRVAKGNEAFLNEFRKERENLRSIGTAKTHPENFRGSTLYELYGAGLEELDARAKNAGAEKVVLSDQSVNAIRARLDAALTRATQKLSAQMVWLTIAISGGPFLGLLGTVVGVMITFAAIAQSGEVNVNAIAPGTAAALAATVAGLGVAIPCLFGYNYLNTRIKDIVADMRVFADEYVARIAEQHS